MHNISTIYRFNTPFLDLEEEKKGLLSVIKKIEKSIEFDGIDFEKVTEKQWKFYKISLLFKCNQDEFNVDNFQKKKLNQTNLPIFNCDLWRVDFFYLWKITDSLYHLPVFKLNIFLNDSFLVNNNSKKKAISFLNNIFECFDWLNEKEYLIDIDNSIYYREWFFKTKKRPSYDFSNIEKIKNDFESKKWMQLLKDFIVKFQNKDFILTRKNADEYHKLHWILLYFIYLVFIISQTIEKTDKTLKNIENTDWDNIYEWNLELMKERLEYVDELNKATFERYKNRLELFFKMF